MLVVVVALVFDYINGFHDTANAVATVVSTGVLPIRTAILLAAVLNFGGALTGTAVAATIGKGLIEPGAVTQVVVLSALLGAIFWNLFTWYFGIPSSSSHALVGGLVGAAMAHAGRRSIRADGLIRVVESLIISPLIGFALGFLVMIAIFWICRRSQPVPTVADLPPAPDRLGRLHGALARQQRRPEDDGHHHHEPGAYSGGSRAGASSTSRSGSCSPAPCAMGVGTMAGGVRIIKTMGTKIIDLKPIHGFAAETSAAVTILGASHLGLPVSTTHVISGASWASARASASRPCAGASPRGSSGPGC